MLVMQWQIIGAHRETGEEKTIVLEAADRATAERRAGRRGLLIEKVLPVATLVETETSPLTSPVISYQSPTQEPPAPSAVIEPPKYVWIVGGSHILGIEAAICLVVAIIGGITAVVAWMNSGSNGSYIAVPATVVFLVGLITGTLLLMCAELALAVRDMARNSFRRD